MFARIYLSLLCSLLFCANTVTAQNSKMEYDGEEVEVTQNIDSRFLGTYIQNEGKRKQLFHLGQNGEESYILIQSLNDTKKMEWNADEKVAIEWGAMLVDGQPVLMQVKEFADGTMKTFTGILIIYKDNKTNTYKDTLLYEVNGSLVLGGFATKVTEVVAN